MFQCQGKNNDKKEHFKDMNDNIGRKVDNPENSGSLTKGNVVLTVQYTSEENQKNGRLQSENLYVSSLEN